MLGRTDQESLVLSVPINCHHQPQQAQIQTRSQSHSHTHPKNTMSLIPPRRTAPIRPLGPLSHPLLRPLSKIPILLRPSPAPVRQIVQNPLWPARPHPQADDRETAPKQHSHRQPQPEHDGAEQHVEDFEREEEDQEEQGQGCQVGLLR